MPYPITTNRGIGDAIEASDINDISNESNTNHQNIDRNARNINNVLLEQYYNGISTPTDGLMIEGFSDTLKANLSSSVLTVDANSAQKVIVVANGGNFIEGQSISIRDNFGHEENIIDTIIGSTITMLNNLANTYAIADNAILEKTTAEINTTNNVLELDETISPTLAQSYSSLVNPFSNKMQTAKMWVRRHVYGGVSFPDASAITPPDNVNSLHLGSDQSQGLRIPLANMTTTFDNLGNAVTIEFWLKMSTLKSTGRIYFWWDWDNNQANAGSQCWLETSTGEIWKSTYSGGGTGYGFWKTATNVITQADVGQWVHFGMAMTNIGFTFYKTGVPYGGGFYGGSSSPNNMNRAGVDSVFFGFPPEYGIYQDSFHGQVCQLRAWNVVRSASEISTNLQNTLTSHVNLLGSWTLDTNLLDDSANGNDGVVIGAPQILGLEAQALGEQHDEKFISGALALSDTSLSVYGDALRFVVGDTIDIYDRYNQTRERKTITGVPDDQTINFTPAIETVGGFVADSLVARVTVLPKLSIVDTDGEENLESPTYVNSLRGTDEQGEYMEDEYEYMPTLPNYDVMTKLDISRVDLDEVVAVTQYGIALTKEI